jgi:translation initiation factor 5
MDNLLELNIGGNSNDKFYRYKMPAITTFHENTNGGTTIITNFETIAKLIYRDTSTLEQYFKKQLSANVRFDAKKGLMIRKKVTNMDLQELLSKYINNYVLCKSCGNPETEFEKKQNKVIFTCKACGNVSIS